MVCERCKKLAGPGELTQGGVVGGRPTYVHRSPCSEPPVASKKKVERSPKAQATASFVVTLKTFGVERGKDLRTQAEEILEEWEMYQSGNPKLVHAAARYLEKVNS